MMFRFVSAVVLLGMLTGCAGNLLSSPDRRRSAREKSMVEREALKNLDEAYVFYEAGDYIMALDRLERSIVLGPRPKAYYELGRTHEAMLNYAKAMEAYRTAVEMAPDLQAAKFALLALEHAPQIDDSDARAAEIAARNEEIQKRREHGAEDRQPTEKEIQTILFSGNAGAGEMPSATDPEYAHEAQVVLGSYAYHFANGERLLASKNYDRASDEFERALRADPDALDARLSLGDALLKMERHHRAYHHYSKAMELHPNSARPLLKMGNYHNSLNRPDLARNYYSQALFIRTDYAEALNNLAAMDIGSGNYTDAIDLLRMALDLEPDYPLAWLNLGIARENTGNTSAALEAYRYYVSLGGDRAEEVSVWISEME